MRLVSATTLASPPHEMATFSRYRAADCKAETLAPLRGRYGEARGAVVVAWRLGA